VTKVFDRPETFAFDALRGFGDLYRDQVSVVPGGVVRAHPDETPRVAVVIGGGSGHYPAFAGLVGPGLADGAVCGEVFSSPSTSRVLDVARRVDRGSGVLLAVGNYAGDRMNFSAAAQQLAAEGIETRLLLVTDDIASGSPDNTSARRGVAGNLLVFKLLAAAAEQGRSLDDMEALAVRINEATRSFGVAFDGCTLPGANEALFDVTPGTMGVGLGIHGEAGVGVQPLEGAAGLGRMLVERIIEERPQQSDGRAAVVLNGLGSTKYEELFILWNSVAEHLRAAGVVPIAPEAGEFVTSLDMAGCSLSVTWLDDDLEELWLAPCSSVAFSRSRGAADWSSGILHADVADRVYGRSAQPSRDAAEVVARALAVILDELIKAESELGRLDAQAGDGDHGVGMVRGVRAALDVSLEAVRQGGGLSSTLDAAGQSWAEQSGGTSGLLWGEALRAAARELSDETSPSGHDVVAAIAAGVDRIIAIGGAKVGDKTLVDAATPFRDEVVNRVQSGVDLASAWRTASVAATIAAEQTSDLMPTLGRAKTAGARNLGTPDPGAVSFGLIVQSVATLIEEQR